MRKIGLDAADIRILSAVQKHGQLSKNKLAEIANLSPTPCWARLDRLKAAGYIQGYRGEIALERVCDFSQVVVTVSLAQHRKSEFERFEAFVMSEPEIIDCIATGGGMDYVMTAVCASLADFQELMERMMATEVSIDRYMTYIVTRRIKKSAPDLARLLARTGASR